jgi:mRNA-degrading endonuclease RelE of RelBE toxin-antitoxin system
VIDLSRKAKKFLAKVKPKEYGQLWGRIQDLQNNPRPNDSEHVTGYPDCFRIDVGEFRVIYGFDPAKRSANRERVPAKKSASTPEPTRIKVVVVGRKNDKAAYKQLKTAMGRG